MMTESHVSVIMMIDDYLNPCGGAHSLILQYT